MKTQIIIAIVIFSTLCFSCNKETIKPPTDINLSNKSIEIIQANNEFGIDLLKKVIETEDEDVNLMISPLSISQALSMTLNGANGTTENEMKEVLYFDEFSNTDFNTSNKEIVDALVPHDSNVELNIANSIWYRDTYSIENDFITTNEDFYNAEVAALDFTKADKAKTTINNWVDDKTNGKIEEIVDAVTADHVMFLINAIYFNASWQFEFNKEDTQDRDFYLANGNTIQVPTMYINTDLEKSYSEKSVLVKIPYGSGKFYMLVMLPLNAFNVADVLGDINQENLNNWLNNLNKGETNLYLPSFEFEYKNKLNDELTDLGMPTAFSNLADFSGINKNKDIKISKVMHKTYIKTDEKGTEAAAVTSVEMTFTSVGPNGGIHVDKPFLFMIMEEDTDAMIFCGKVANPTLN